MKHINSLVLFFSLVLCLTLTGCKTDSTTDDPVGSLINQNGCIQFASATALKNTAETPIVPPGEECISYQYDPSRTLYLQHINGGFNCCPGDITADITIGETSITIIEAESSEEKCHCLCLYNLDYEIKNIDPGKYIITLSGPLKQIIAEIDLHRGYTGNVCVKRTEYPWLY